MNEDAPVTIALFTETMVDFRAAIERMEARIDQRLAQHDQLFARLHDRFDDVRAEMKDGFDRVDSEMKAGFDRVDRRLARLEPSER